MATPTWQLLVQLDHLHDMQAALARNAPERAPYGERPTEARDGEPGVDETLMTGPPAHARLGS